MDSLLLEQLNKLTEFESQIEEFEARYQNQNKELEEINIQREAEFELWKATLTSEISHYQSDIQSKHLSLLGNQLKLETTKANHALEQQKTLALQNECNKLKIKYEKLKRDIRKQQFGNLEECEVSLAWSLHYQREWVVSGMTFHGILVYCDLQCVFICERVSKSWRRGILNWLGWLNYQYKHIHDIHEIAKTTPLVPVPPPSSQSNKIQHERKESIGNNSVGSGRGGGSGGGSGIPASLASSLDTKDSDALFYPKFRRFVLAIETQKNNMYKIEVIGFADKTSPVQNNIVHDRNKRKVILQPIEGDAQLQKEFSICDVILANHQKLAKIKAQTERFKNRCESDERTKKGYQLQKEETEKQMKEVDNDVKELELQQQSDVSTIQFLQQQISTLEQQIEDMAQIPERLKAEEAQREAEFEQKMKELEEDSTNSFQEQLIKVEKEKDILTKEIKTQQARLQQATQSRDELKQRYDFLKNELTKLSAV